MRYSKPPKPGHIAGYFVLWLALGVGLWVVFTRTGSRESSLLLYLFLLGAAGGIYLVLMVNRWRLCARLDAPELNVLNARPCLGEPIEFDVRVKAHRPVTVARVLAVLSCSEEARNEPRHRNALPVVIHRTETVLGENIPLTPDEPTDLAGEIVVPANGMQSFESHLCTIRWQLDVLVFVGPHLAYRETEVLGVQPMLMEEGEVDP
jgi:hypothetical protein